MNDKERELFELEAIKIGCVTARDSASGEYYNYITNWLWQIWQSARNLSAIPDDMVLVPREPTPEMLQAGFNRIRRSSGGVWEAMIAAAPTTPKGVSKC